jgi:hypothetical protein
MKRFFAAALLLLCLYVLASAQISAGTGESRNEVLRGLKGCFVAVEIEPAIERAAPSLNRSEIGRAVVKRLQAAGVYIGSDLQINHKPAPPALVVILSGTIFEGALLYRVELELQEPATLEYRSAAGPHIVTSWRSGSSGAVLTAEASTLRRQIDQQVEKFLSEWARVNRRQGGR